MQRGAWLRPGSPWLWGNSPGSLGRKVPVGMGSSWMFAQWQKWKEVVSEGWSRGRGKSKCNDAFWVAVRSSRSALLIGDFLTSLTVTGVPTRSSMAVASWLFV